MIKLIKGAKLNRFEELSEGYKIDNNSIEAVVDANNILNVIKSFINLFENKLFFIFIEAPCNITDEKTVRNNEIEVLHKDIYYLDGITSYLAMELLNLFGEILLNDGMVSFGVGTKEAEIGKYKYNMVKAFSSDIEKLKFIFTQNNIVENNEFKSPWDLINNNNLGESFMYKDADNKTVYDVIDTLKEVGLYKAETREE